VELACSPPLRLAVRACFVGKHLVDLLDPSHSSRVPRRLLCRSPGCSRWAILVSDTGAAWQWQHTLSSDCTARDRANIRGGHNNADGMYTRHASRTECYMCLSIYCASVLWEGAGGGMKQVREPASLHRQSLCCWAVMATKRQCTPRSKCAIKPSEVEYRPDTVMSPGHVAD
jgi:hypothetical protein